MALTVLGVIPARLASTRLPRKVLRDLAGPIDIAFIDADKPATRDYFDLIWPKLRPGGSVLIDNAITHRAELADVVKYVRRLPEAASTEVAVPSSQSRLTTTSTGSRSLWTAATTSSDRYPATTTIRSTPASSSALTPRSNKLTPPTRRNAFGCGDRVDSPRPAASTTARPHAANP